MFEERNIFMTDKFIEILTNLNYLFPKDNSVVTCIELGEEITGEYKEIMFFPPNYTSDLDCIYCDVEGYKNDCIKKFYDSEYLYDVEKTYQMKSKGHKALKHNVNIFSNRIDSKYRSDFAFNDGKFEDIQKIHHEWIATDVVFEENKALMIDLIVNHINAFTELQRKVFYLEGEPVGFILFDESPSYIHVFFSYAIPTVEYVHDYMMWMFFRYLMQKKTKKLVNFGGVYGDNNIKKDKDRLCPYVVRDRWSWLGRSHL